MNPTNAPELMALIKEQDRAEKALVIASLEGWTRTAQLLTEHIEGIRLTADAMTREYLVYGQG